MADKLSEVRIVDASEKAVGLANNDQFSDKLNLAGGGVMILTMAGLSGHAFENALSILQADRHTSIDDVLEIIKKKK